MKSLAFALTGVAIGVALAAQAGVNSHLRGWMHTPLQAAFASFATGTVVLAVLVLAGRGGLPSGLAQAPWWAWMGGLLGIVNITASILLAPRLGALTLAMLVITGQIISSMLFDHFGLLGYRRAPMQPDRLVGAALLVAGAYLAVRK